MYKSFYIRFFSSLIILNFFFFNNNSFAQCIHSVSPTSIVLPADGGNDYVYITTEECEYYNAYSSDSWIYVSVDYNEQIVSIYADANREGFRQGTVTIHDTESESDFNITVSQDFDSCPQLEAPGTITGPSTACNNSNGTFSINPLQGATFYTWSLNGQSISNCYGTSATISLSSFTSPAVVSVCGNNECGSGLYSTKNITIYFSPNPGAISSDQTICYNSAPSLLNNVTSASGGTAPYYYQWQSMVSGSSTWNNIASATSTTYQPPVLTAPTQYRRTVTDSRGCTMTYSNTVSIAFYSLNGGEISGDNISYGGNSGVITSSKSAFGGSGSYAYYWEKQVSGGTTWSTITCYTADFPSVTQTVSTYYRRKVTDNICGNSAYSNILPKMILSECSYLSGSDIINPETRTLNIQDCSVGTINGEVQVDPLGASTYSINIDVPVGINGLTPNVSLEYSSSNDNGDAGYGWNLGGISSIFRGGTSYYQDGVLRGISFNGDDKFYLDGQRLILTSSGTYGSLNTVYQTDIANFANVREQAFDNTTGPVWFQAETKSGLIYEYGNSPTSYYKIGNRPQMLGWYVSKISDRFDNHIDYEYMKDNNNIFLSNIIYGPNKIVFSYKLRNDIKISYLNGETIANKLILDKIEVYFYSNNNYNLIRTYQLDYIHQVSGYNSSSLLHKVTEIGLNGEKFNSSAFSYYNPESIKLGTSKAVKDSCMINKYYKILPGDFDGDGKDELLCVPPPEVDSMYVVDGDTPYDPYLEIPRFYTVSRIYYFNLIDLTAIDLNGDGKEDIVYRYEGSSVFYYRLSGPDSFTPAVEVSAIPSGAIARLHWWQIGSYKYHAGYANKNVANDYNGDGISDIFVCDDSGNWEIKSFMNSSGQLLTSLSSLKNGNESGLNGNREILSADFNGDGKTDIWSIQNSGTKIYSFNGTSLELLFNDTSLTYSNFFNLGDFNGDGKVDVFAYGDGKNGTEHDWNNWQIRLSTGTGFFCNYIPQLTDNLKDDRVRVSDFNGDGRSDVFVIPHLEYLYWKLYYSKKMVKIYTLKPL